MNSMFVLAEMSAASAVLRYAAAFFFILVAVAAAYALFKAGKTLERVDKTLLDVDTEGVPLMRKAGVTLDEINAGLSNVDEITQDVAGITDKLDTMANAVEGAVSTPARKAAAFGAGVQSAFSSFLRRDDAAASASGDAAGATRWPSGEWRAPAAGSSAADEAGDAAAKAADAVKDVGADAAKAAAPDAAGSAASATEDAGRAASSGPAQGV